MSKHIPEAAYRNITNTAHPEAPAITVPIVRWPAPESALMSACDAPSRIAVGAPEQRAALAGAAARVSLPFVRWPPPPERPYLTASQALTWIGWGKACPKERASDLEVGLLDVWGVSGKRFDDLICAFETGQSQERLIATPEQVRDRIRKREGRDYTFAELAARLRRDRVVLAEAYELLELASDVLIKAWVDGELQPVGQRGNEPASAIPPEASFQAGVTVNWWDTIEAGRMSWRGVRFRASDIVRLWPARQVESEPTPECDVPRTDHPAASAPLIGRLSGWFADWADQHPKPSEAETMEAARGRFPSEHITRRMIRDLLKSPDGDPRPRGKKPGKSHSEHARRMRS